MRILRSGLCLASVACAPIATPRASVSPPPLHSPQDQVDAYHAYALRRSTPLVTYQERINVLGAPGPVWRGLRLFELSNGTTTAQPIDLLPLVHENSEFAVHARNVEALLQRQTYLLKREKRLRLGLTGPILLGLIGAAGVSANLDVNNEAALTFGAVTAVAALAVISMQVARISTNQKRVTVARETWDESFQASQSYDKALRLRLGLCLTGPASAACGADGAPLLPAAPAPTPATRETPPRPTAPEPPSPPAPQ